MTLEYFLAIAESGSLEVLENKRQEISFKFWYYVLGLLTLRGMLETPLTSLHKAIKKK